MIDEFMMGVLVSMIGFLGYRVGVLAYYQMKINRMKYKYPRKQDKSRQCEGHEWENTLLVLPGLAIGKYNICLKCGQISGTDFELNDPGLEQAQQAFEQKQKERKYQEYLIQRVDDVVDHRRSIYVDQNVGNFTDAAKADDTELIRDLMSDLFKYACKSYQDANTKVLDEEAHQRDLDRRYAGWKK